MATRFHWSVYWACALGLVLVLVGGGYVAGRVTTPAPDPTIVVEGAPACVEAIAAAQDVFDQDEIVDRSRAKAVDATADVLPANQEGRAADLLAAIKASDAHLTDQVEAGVKRDAARRLFDDAAAKCAPERQP